MLQVDPLGFASRWKPGGEPAADVGSGRAGSAILVTDASNPRRPGAAPLSWSWPARERGRSDVSRHNRLLSRSMANYMQRPLSDATAGNPMLRSLPPRSGSRYADSADNVDRWFACCRTAAASVGGLRRGTMMRQPQPWMPAHFGSFEVLGPRD
jgi:hypothetical protein